MWHCVCELASMTATLTAQVLERADKFTSCTPAMCYDMDLQAPAPVMSTTYAMLAMSLFLYAAYPRGTMKTES